MTGVPTGLLHALAELLADSAGPAREQFQQSDAVGRVARRPRLPTAQSSVALAQGPVHAAVAVLEYPKSRRVGAALATYARRSHTRSRECGYGDGLAVNRLPAPLSFLGHPAVDRNDLGHASGCS